MDDLEEATGISESVHRSFFHKFVHFGETVLYPKYVKYPKCQEEAATHTMEYQIAGLCGAIGSMDSCHVIMEKCSHRLKQNHFGGKSKQTCRSFNLTCNHRRKILHTTSGHPARWNDKTIVLFDDFATDLRNGNIMGDNSFVLFEHDGSDIIVEVKYCGAWLIVDNGYLEWSVTIPPMKDTMYYKETRWSEWMESMRKDVECTFGILKGRFRILKAGVRCHGVDVTDKIWKTCCALHNVLLEKDGLSHEWSGALGEFDFDEETDEIPFALQRLSSPSERRQYDDSGMGPGVLHDEDDGDISVIPPAPILFGAVRPDDINNVHQISMDVFQNKLIEHFDILFQKNEIRWPKSNVGNCRMPTPL